MKTSIKSVLVLSAVALLLAACGTVGSSTPPSSAPSSPPPSVAPSDAPSETPDASEAPAPVVVGTLTVADGAVVDGPGASLAEALAGDLSQPVLVRGFVFKDTDGKAYFADDMTAGDRLVLANYPTDGPTWDIGDAAVTGLQEADGVLFYEDSALYGTISE